MKYQYRYTEKLPYEKIFTVEANKNGQNDRIIAVDFQSAYKKVKCLNKTSHSSSMMVFGGNLRRWQDSTGFRK
uniref:Uncharacterized protein n=1 Tax=Caenorhabditis japonica TaxID=281687 RepID=A0A8R1EDB6_CAEJA